MIGETTQGNVELLLEYNFADGSRAWIAHDTFHPLNHPQANWEQTGIVPDLNVAAAWDLYTLATDPAVQAALDYFGYKVVLNEYPPSLEIVAPFLILTN